MSRLIKRRIVILLLSLLFSILLVSILFLDKKDGFKENKNYPLENPYIEADLNMEIIPSEGESYGYNILINERRIIHQPNIPALPGSEGFQTREEAKKVAELVINKIQNNILPPSITIQELDSLRITY